VPLYEYRCDACGQRVEVIQKLSDPPPDACRACGKGPLVRLLSSPAIQFKGSGWYITDYARKSNTTSGEAATAPKDGGSAGAGDSGKAVKEQGASGPPSAPAAGSGSKTDG
jgi:putative FmdB family regulatory protein